MTVRLSVTIVALAVFGFGLPATAHRVEDQQHSSQKKGKPQPPPESADVVGIAWINHEAPSPCPLTTGPGIHSDCLGTNGAYVPDGGENYPALLGETGAFWLRTFGERFVTIDFSDQEAAPTCGSSCYGPVATPLSTTIPRGYGQDWTSSLHGNVIDENGTALPGGFMGLSIGESRPVRFFVNFPDPGGDRFHWTVFFDEIRYPGSEFAMGTRTGECSWSIVSEGSGQLVAGGTPKNRATEEGVFYMPFQINFEAPGCASEQ